MTPYFVTLGKGLSGPARLQGVFFLGERALYFLCTSVGRTSVPDHSAFGPIGRGIDAYLADGSEPTVDERELADLVAATEHSMAFTPERTELFKQSMWGCKIVFDGQKVVVWNPGFPPALRSALRLWGDQNGVATKGMK